MKKLDSVTANSAVFYIAPDRWTDPLDILPLIHDLEYGRRSGEACMVSHDTSGTWFVSVGERLDDWVERRKGGTT